MKSCARRSRGKRPRGRARWALVFLLGALCALLPGHAGKGAVWGAVWWDARSRKPRRTARAILAYGSGGMARWSADRLRYYIAHVRPDGSVDDWFFDTVVFLALASDKWRGLCPGFGNEPSRAEDWRWYLDERLFGGYQEVAQLDEAVRAAGKELGSPGHIVWVIIVVPYPDPRRTDFGALGDRELDLSRTEDRAEAVRWYMGEVARRWGEGRFQHLRLGGFYWVHEEIPEGDRELIKLASGLAAQQLVPLYWIPFYEASGNVQWQRLGFDVVIQQPNYYFYDVPIERLRDTALIAQRYLMGMELELDRRVLTSDERRQRYRSYLDAGVAYGYQRAGTLAWYDDTALLECARSPDPEVRRVYDDTHAFVRGSYRGR